jgi:YD repeat-containing protein
MALLAVSGWGAFAYAAKSAGLARQLQEELAKVTARQDQLIRERDQAKTQLAAARDAQERLLAERDQATFQLAATQQELRKVQRQLLASAKVSATGSLREQPSDNPSPKGPKGASTKTPQKDRVGR